MRILVWAYYKLVWADVLLSDTTLKDKHRQDLSADRYSAWTRQKTTLFSGHYLPNRSTLDIGVLGYIGIL